MPAIDADVGDDILFEIGPDLSLCGNTKCLAVRSGVCLGKHASSGKRKPNQTRGGYRQLDTNFNLSAHTGVCTNDCRSFFITELRQTAPSVQ